MMYNYFAFKHHVSVDWPFLKNVFPQLSHNYQWLSTNCDWFSRLWYFEGNWVLSRVGRLRDGRQKVQEEINQKFSWPWSLFACDNSTYQRYSGTVDEGEVWRKIKGIQLPMDDGRTMLYKKVTKPRVDGEVRSGQTWRLEDGAACPSSFLSFGNRHCNHHPFAVITTRNNKNWNEL